MSYGYGKTSFKSESVDAFGRLRISDLISQFESKFHYGNEDKSYNTTVVSGGSATFLPNESAFSLTTTTASGSSCLRESYRYLQYHPGKSQIVMLTGVFGAPLANCVKRAGYYDNSDGLFFLQNGVNGFGICRRTSTSGTPVDNIVYQSSWNLDKLDGTGSSGITVDLTKTQIMVIDFQWLGVGAVRFGMVIDGALIYVHQMNHANILTEVYMKSAWLPLRYEIVNIGTTTTSGTFKQICSMVSSESGMEERGTIRSAQNSTTVSISTGSWTPIIGVRVNETLNGQLFRGIIRLLGMETIVTANNAMMFKIVENPTLTGANWITVDANSPVSYDLSATSYTGGIDRLAVAGTSGKSGTSSNAPEDLVGHAGTTYYLVGRGIGGTSTAYCAVNWREIL
jgi:hypothetical protein